MTEADVETAPEAVVDPSRRRTCLIVVLAMAVVLFLLLGSVVLPIKAIGMTLLSLTASFGALVWIFQDGNLAGLLGFEAPGYTVAGKTGTARHALGTGVHAYDSFKIHATFAGFAPAEAPRVAVIVVLDIAQLLNARERIVLDQAVAEAEHG